MRHLRLLVGIVLLAGAAAHAAETGIEAYAKLVGAHPALAARWRFEANLSDDKALAHGQPGQGTPAFINGPAGGQALSLSDESRVAMGKAPKLDLPETTIELWFRPTFEPGTRPNPCLIAKRADSPRTRFSIHLWGDYSCLAVWNGRQVMRYFPQGRPLRKGEWFYLAVAARGNDVRVYLDALACRRQGPRAGFTLAARNHPLRIGWPQPGSKEVFLGAIDEVAIYSKALAVDELERHMDAMGAKTRVTREQIAAKLAAERKIREAASKNRLAELMDPKALFATAGPTVYRGDHLAAIELPVGGIGTGSVSIDGRAVRPIWRIFNSVQPAVVPNSFFAIRVAPAGGAPVLRALQTVAVGPFAAMKALSFRGEYPFGWFDFEDDGLPVQIGLETFNPLIPLDARGSAIPCAIYTFTVKNPAKEPVDVHLLATQLNAVGYTGKGNINGDSHPGFGGNTNRIVRSKNAAILHLTAARPDDAPGQGDMALAVLAPRAWGQAAWQGPEKLASGCEGPPLDGPAPGSPKGKTHVGALGAPFTLKPGEARAVTFVLAWHFPNAQHGSRGWGGRGNMYANWWPDALAVARDVVGRLDELTAGTRRYHDAFYASNLPRWLLDRISSQLVVLRSPTVFWTKAGYLGAWEGCSVGTGCCRGNCNHVWHYAQAHARVFPAIARLLREQELRHMAPDGAIPHRQPRSHPAFDGQCGGILGAWREHLMSPDGAWLAKHWPAVKKAMDYTITRWDNDGDGILAGPQWNTLDGNLGGSTSWLGTLYLAALAASEKMALLEGEPKAAQRFHTIRLAGSTNQDATLFNGHYYIQLPDPKPQQDYGNGCHIDQLLGQWWAHQLDLGWLYPPDHCRTALRALFQQNFRPVFHGIRQAPRKFVADPDPGMQMITWPGGDRPAGHMRYADEVMSGFEYAAAAAMVQAGLLDEGFTIVRAAAIRYDGRLRKGLTISGGWRTGGNPFCDDECGKFYARPMSIWSVLLACQGAIVDSPAGLLGFKPVWRPDDHKSFFTTATAWGLYTQARADRKQTHAIAVHHGSLALKTLIFALPKEAKNPKVTLHIADRPIPATAAPSPDTLRIRLSRPTTINTGETLAITATW